MRFVSSVVALIALVGCAGIDHGVEWTDGNFEIAWTDLTSNAALAYRQGTASYTVIIEPCVTSVGSNEAVVVVEQIAPGDQASTFYVLYKAAYQSPSQARPEALVGPLSGSAYAALRAQQVMPQLKQVLSPDTCRGAA